MNPLLLAALPGILDRLFDTIEYVSKRTNGTLPESFIADRTLVRQHLVQQAESLTAPQDNTFIAVQGSGPGFVGVSNSTGGTMTNPDTGRVAYLDGHAAARTFTGSNSNDDLGNTRYAGG